MRRLVETLAGPLFESIVGRLDPTVSIEDHLAFIRACSEATRDGTDPRFDACSNALSASLQTLASTPSATATQTPGPSLPEPRELAEHQHRLQLAERALEDICEPAPPPREPLPGSFDWLADPTPAREAARSCSIALRSIGTDRGDHISTLETLQAGLPASKWFVAKRGVIYGSATLVRSLIKVHADGPNTPPDLLSDYLSEVFERLLRHAEIRRADAMQLCTHQVPDSASAFRERVRFCLAALDWHAATDDPRFLNVALKLSDHRLLDLTGVPAAANVEGWCDVAYYSIALARQEVAMWEAFGR